MSDLWTIAGGIAAVFAIVGGLYGGYELVRRQLAARPFTKPLYVFADSNDLRDELLKLRGRTVHFDTVIDFSVGTEFSYRLATETEYRTHLAGPASDLNRKRLPLFVTTQHGTRDTFAALVVAVRDAERLKFSHGGTGVVQVLLKGRFDVEVRAYSGPSVEITLRELS